MSSYAKEREEHRMSGQDLVELVVRTRVPGKWRLVDMETGEVWRWSTLADGWREAGLVARTARVLAGWADDR